MLKGNGKGVLKVDKVAIMTIIVKKAIGERNGKTNSNNSMSKMRKGKHQ